MATTKIITSQLRELKLSGAAEMLEVRLMEAQSNQLSYSELISLILADEIETRQNRKLKLLTSKARLEADKTLEHFDFSFNPSVKPLQIKELSTCRFIENGENIFFIGPTGTGKTFLAKALGHCACRRNMRVEYYNFHEFFSLLAKADLVNRLDRVFRQINKADLLIIDDFAFKKIDQHSAKLFYSIVEDRYRVKSIILTSNRVIGDWTDIFPDPVMAGAIMDRLCHNTHQIIIKGESYRKKYRPKFEST